VPVAVALVVAVAVALVAALLAGAAEVADGPPLQAVSVSRARAAPTSAGCGFIAQE
jgi:hypothetical protein